MVNSGVGKLSRVDDGDAGLKVATEEISQRHSETSSPGTELRGSIFMSPKMISDHVFQIRNLIDAGVDSGTARASQYDSWRSAGKGALGFNGLRLEVSTIASHIDTNSSTSMRSQALCS